MLVITSLQKRLLSSIEAFSRTLRVHRKAMERKAAQLREIEPDDLGLLWEAAGMDDERAELSEDEVQAEEDAQMQTATEQSSPADRRTARELEVLEEMTEVAKRARHKMDPRVQRLVEWIRANQCPDLGMPGAKWNHRRVLIFTEYTDTKRYLLEQLQSAIAGSDREDERIEVFHGGIGEERREAIKAAFNADPAKHPLRILIATDAAREGVNLQNHCADLFHFDVPWNPSRMEQRNGRIDRKLQRSPVVCCHYFVLAQRPEDRVLETLVRKTSVIQKELGSLSPVVERNLGRLLSTGIRHEQVPDLEISIESVDQTGRRAVAGAQVIEEELEQVRKRRDGLNKELQELRGLLDTSENWLGLSDEHFRNAISASLSLLGVEALVPLSKDEAVRDAATARWVFPSLDQKPGADPTWAATLDTLRTPRKRKQKPWEWRREAPIRPVVFRDPGTLDGEVVHLHLEHRVVQRLLGRFLAQGFLHDELTRACVCKTDDAIPKVLALGRLSLYGDNASRLHDEIVAVAARWSEPSTRGRSKLRPLTETAKKDVLTELNESLATPRLKNVSPQLHAKFQTAAVQDVEELLPHLQKRAETLAGRAEKRLTTRGDQEARAMREILEAQRKRIAKRQEETTGPQQLALGFSKNEQRQLEADRRHWDKRIRALGHGDRGGTEADSAGLRGPCQSGRAGGAGVFVASLGVEGAKTMTKPMMFSWIDIPFVLVASAPITHKFPVLLGFDPQLKFYAESGRRGRGAHRVI